MEDRRSTLSRTRAGFAILNPRSSMRCAEAFMPEVAMIQLRDAALRLRMSAGVLAAGLLALAGCGGSSLYPVHGNVVWENGAEARELAGGLVISESVNGAVGARGDIEQDGSFRLSTHKPGD